jgi:transposase
MLTWPATVRVFLCTAPTDLRRSFDSLAALTREILHQDPLSGHLFVFVNRGRDRVKILLWDRHGYWLFYRRLERGTFPLPSSAEASMELEAADLALILEGIELSGAKRRARFMPGVGG